MPRTNFAYCFQQADHKGFIVHKSILNACVCTSLLNPTNPQVYQGAWGIQPTLELHAHDQANNFVIATLRPGVWHEVCLVFNS